MAHSLSKILLHVVFSTKNRKKLLSERLQARFKEKFLDFLQMYGVEYNERYLWD